MRRMYAVGSATALVVLAISLASCKGNGYGTTQPPVTGGELGSPTLAASVGAYPHAFNTAGTFRYKCTIHPSCTTLQGKVTVVSAATPILGANHVLGITFSGGTAGTYATCSMLSDQDDSVHVGETVTWTNTSPLPHTVTSF